MFRLRYRVRSEILARFKLLFWTLDSGVTSTSRAPKQDFQTGPLEFYISEVALCFLYNTCEHKHRINLLHSREKLQFR